MGVPVMLNVYDLTTQNDWTYHCGIGVFHTGVEVYGVEYAFGGHEYDVSGVFATNPREAPGAVMFRESIFMGETGLSQSQVQVLVQQMGQQYKGNTYHLLQSNCNHFASDFCMQLVGRQTPAWVNRLAGLAVMLHCLLPPTWVPPLQTPSLSPEFEPRTMLKGRPQPWQAQQDNSHHHLLQPDSPASDSFLEPPRPITTTDRWH